MTRVETSLRDVFRAHAQFVGRSLRALGVPAQDVEDSVQEVFLVVERRLAEYRERGSIRSWLYAICLFVARSRRRGARERTPPVLASEPPDGGSDPEQDVVRRRSFEQALRLLDALGEEQRAAFLLYEVEELTLREVAEALGCPLQTAYSRIHAARQRLREAVRVLHGEGRST